MIKLIKTKRYKSAKDFLEDISYGKKMYQNLKDGFVFRGHQSGTYKLVPSVLRHKIHMKDAAGNVLEDDWDAPFNIMYDSKSFTLAEIEMRTGVKRPTLYLYLNRRKNGEL